VPWKRPRFALIPVADVERLTGLEPAELLRKTSTEHLVRVDEHGRREECVRLPVELLLEPDDETV
jgi:hypothetical protein